MANVADSLARPSAGRQAPSTRTIRHVLGNDWQLGWLLVAPVILLVSAVIIYPFLDAILLSFQERFIGKAGWPRAPSRALRSAREPSLARRYA